MDTKELVEQKYNQLFDELKEQHNRYLTVCEYCRAKPMAHICVNCGAPQGGYDPSPEDLYRLKIKAHILVNAELGVK